MVLDNSEINNLCLSIVDRSFGYSNLLHASFLTLFNTGARCGEVANLALWSINPDNSVSWQTIKRGGIRTVSSDLVPDIFKQYISNRPPSNFICSKRGLRSTFDLLCPYQSVYTLDKRISTHLFRHNRIKQLYDSGWSVDSIATYFAVGSVDVPLYYINSVIYT